MPCLTLTDGTQVHYRGKANLSPEARAELVTAIEKVIAEIDQAETAHRAALARAAFSGGFPRLDAYLRDRHGYLWDSVYYPANSVSLAEYIKWVQALDAATLAQLCGEADV